MDLFNYFSWCWCICSCVDFQNSVCCAYQDGPAATRTLDLASTLEVGSGTARPSGEADGYNLRSVLTIAFQFTFENHLRDNVAAMARQYVRSVVGSVQRVAMAIAPSRLSNQLGPKSLPGSPEAHSLARWISRSYRFVCKSIIFLVAWYFDEVRHKCRLIWPKYFRS